MEKPIIQDYEICGKLGDRNVYFLKKSHYVQKKRKVIKTLFFYLARGKVGSFRSPREIKNICLSHGKANNSVLSFFFAELYKLVLLI